MTSRLLPRRPAASSSVWSMARACRAAGIGALLLSGAVLATATPAAAAMFGYGMSAPDVADMLYARYRVARVMRVVPTGDVFQADAIDRRGFRIHYTIDGYTGEVLESFVMGRVAYEPAVPVPPGLVPGGPALRDVPPASDEEIVRPEPRRQPLPQKGRQARTPDPSAPVPGPKVKQVPAPKPSAPAPVTPAPATAARQPAEKPPEPVAPAAPQVVAPPAQAVKPVTPAQPGVGESKAPEVRQAAPARLPEPLIDPKTGQPSGGVPVAPLDAPQPDAKPPITIVPPAPLE